MSRGHIRSRGKSSWEIRFAVPSDVPGQRKTRTLTVRGKRADAERKLVELLRRVDTGSHVDPSRTTLAEYLAGWVDDAQISPKTRERYAGLIRNQIVPHLGTAILQQLTRDAVKRWHKTLRVAGGVGGKPLADLTVLHAHRTLAVALAAAREVGLVASNVASDIAGPRVTKTKPMEILRAGETKDVLAKLAGHDLYAVVHVALSTGARRGELLALRWMDVDLDRGAIRIVHSLEELDDGSVRLKEPKSAAGRRSITIPAQTVDVLRAHRVRQLQQRLLLGLGRPEPEAIVFARHDGTPLSPNNLTRQWRAAVKALGLPVVGFHALRHTHASALIAAKEDVVLVSKRLGHGNPSITMTVYAHLFERDDRSAAVAIGAILG